jgi:hypothetical protein
VILLIEGKGILAGEKDLKEVKTMLMCLDIYILEENSIIVEKILLEMHRLTVKDFLPDTCRKLPKSLGSCRKSESYFMTLVIH